MAKAIKVIVSATPKVRLKALSIPTPVKYRKAEAGLTCLRGGRDRMKSKMSSWASFFTLGGMSPST